jgi:zinc transport system substrate-binding protein
LFAGFYSGFIENIMLQVISPFSSSKNRLTLREIVLLGVGLMCLSMGSYANGQKQVKLVEQSTLLVSLHPMALLIKSAWPTLNVSSLVGANQSPHNFVLKPSDMTRIKAADAVLWMGPNFEPYLQNAIRGMVQVDLSQAINTDGHSDHRSHEGEHDAHHDKHSSHDPHLWLAPSSIKPVINQVRQALNLPKPSQFLLAYDAWLIQAHSQLSKMKQIGFVSYHGAFQDWIETFALNQLAVVTSNPEKPVGTRHIIEVRNILASGQAKCLFVEPQFQTPIVKKLHKGLDIKVINIDPMASNYRTDDAGFISFYSELLSNFAQCLKR